MICMSIISAAKKAYEDRKAAKLTKKLSEKKEFLERNAKLKTEELKKTTRKPAVISQEYNRWAGELGDKKYKSTVLIKECEQIELHMKKLNEEFYTSTQVYKDEIEAERSAHEAAEKARQAVQAKTATDSEAQASAPVAAPQGASNEASI